MYILKNAWKNITRNKGRNILIGIIIVVISAACSVTLAIRESASKIVKSYEESNEIEASISMNRQNLMKDLSKESSQEDMINSFNDIESLTLDEIKSYGDSSYVKNYYYYYKLSVDAKNLTEATDSLVKETTETKTETTTNPFGKGDRPDMPMGGSETTNKTTTTKTEKIFNQKAENGAFTLLGYDSYDSMTEFVDGTYTITDGAIFDNFEDNNCVISSELASLNSLSVGDTITIVDPNNSKKTYTLTITGIYTENSETSNDMTSMFSNSANSIITTSNFINTMLEADDDLNATITPTYILTSSDVIDSFSSEVSEKGLSSYYTVTTNLETIQNATKSVSNVKTFASTFLIITLIIGGVVLIVINMINIRERKYEIGVLRTIGMNKIKLSLQFMLELFIVAFASLIIGAGIGSICSVKIANNLLASEIENTSESYNDIDKNFGKSDMKDKGNFNVSNVSQVNDINAVVDIKVLGELFGIGILLTLLGSMAAFISINRFSPLTILKERG